MEKKILSESQSVHVNFDKGWVANIWLSMEDLDKVEELLNQGKEVILEIDVNGATQVREKCKDAAFIFLVPPTRQSLYDRLKSRGTESEEKINARINKADREFKLAHQYDYIVVNDEIHNAADRIMAIIRAEHAKTFRSIHEYLKLIEEEKTNGK